VKAEPSDSLFEPSFENQSEHNHNGPKMKLRRRECKRQEKQKKQLKLKPSHLMEVPNVLAEN